MTPTSQLAPHLVFAWQDWATLFFHYMSLSLLAIADLFAKLPDPQSRKMSQTKLTFLDGL